MALFGKNKKNTEAKEVQEAQAPVTSSTVVPKNLDRIILGPRITEKATSSAEFLKAYVFNVATDASKKDIAAAIEMIYKVTPVKIRTVRVPSKKIYRRGTVGMKKEGKKAYVYLDKKDKIEFV